MIDFKLVREEAYNGLRSIYSMEKVVSQVKNKRGIPKNVVYWKVIVEIPANGKIKDFELLINLKDDFPLSIPEIFLSEKDYDSIKYIPHVDDRRNICLFDQEYIKIDTDRPAKIIKDCIEKAKKIIVEGLNKVNSADFKDEVIAYWVNTYSYQDSVFPSYIGEGIEQLKPGRTPVHYLLQPYNNVNIFLGSESADSERVVDFLKLRGHKIELKEAFYLGNIEKLEPSFYFNNKALLNFLNENFSSLLPQVKSYLNQSLDLKILVFSLMVENEILFFGFYLDASKKTPKGWRQQSVNTMQIMSTIKPTQPVTRLMFNSFSPDRLRKRTDGSVRQLNPFKFMLAGLGSIGSNLLFYLNTLDVSNFILVDPEVLQLENVNRHLLSFNEVGQYKVEAIAKYLTYNNPFLGIEKHQTSIIDIARKHINKINEMDILFCAIGKDSIETYILQLLAGGKISKPVVLLWVEPYLLGAHVLYINPQTDFQLDNIESDGYYMYNIIDKSTYNDPEKQLLLREAGCQGSYTPYGKEAITSFFALFIPELFLLVKDRPSENLAFTYIGDLDVAIENKIEISDFAQDKTHRQLLKHTI